MTKSGDGHRDCEVAHWNQASLGGLDAEGSNYAPARRHRKCSAIRRESQIA
jgi:hypothetical protein